MGTMLDIISSAVLGAILFMNILNATAIVSENSAILNGDVTVQQLLISNAQLVEGEFRNMGMGVREDAASVISATDTSIRFLSDLSRDGTPDTISYWTGSVNELAQTQNEMDRLLHRRLNSGPVQSIGAVTKFRMRYFSQGEMDTLVPPIAAIDMEMIKVVEITMEVQNPYALYRDPRDIHSSADRDALYSSSYWRQTRLASQNLKR